MYARFSIFFNVSFFSNNFNIWCVFKRKKLIGRHIIYTRPVRVKGCLTQYRGSLYLTFYIYLIYDKYTHIFTNV